MQRVIVGATATALLFDSINWRHARAFGIGRSTDIYSPLSQYPLLNPLDGSAILPTSHRSQLAVAEFSETDSP
jgi:hypothetical protein